MTDLAARLGCSRWTIHRLERAVLSMLREALDPTSGMACDSSSHGDGTLATSSRV